MRKCKKHPIQNMVKCPECANEAKHDIQRRDCEKSFWDCKCRQLTGEQFRRAFLAGHPMFPVTAEQVEVFEELTKDDEVEPMPGNGYVFWIENENKERLTPLGDFTKNQDDSLIWKDEEGHAELIVYLVHKGISLMNNKLKIVHYKYD